MNYPLNLPLDRILKVIVKPSCVYATTSEGCSSPSRKQKRCLAVVLLFYLTG
jgi:hypothetical protein